MVRRELIGKNGENVKELEQRTNVIKICTMEHLKAINQRRAQQNMQPSFHEEEPCEDPNMMKLVIIGPKEMVPFAKMLIKSQVTSIQERQKFIDRQREANMEMNDGQQQYDNGGYNQGYDQQYDDGQHWDQYGSQQQMMNNNRNGDRNGQRNGNQRSPRRQRRQQQQQQQTERSAKSTEEFNYLNNGGGSRRRDRQQQMPQNNDPHYPGLGAKGKGVYVNDETNGGGDAKDVSHDEDAQQHEKSWVDMQENEDEEEEQHYEQPQRDVRNVNQQQKQKNNNNKQQKAQIWKVKSTNEESNEVEVNE